MAFFEGLNLLPIILYECSIDVEKTGNRKYIKEVFIDRERRNTDVNSLDTNLIEAEAIWETTPEAKNKESSSDFGEMSDTDSYSNSGVDSDRALMVGKTELKDEKAFAVYSAPKTSTILASEVTSVSHTEDEVRRVVVLQVAIDMGISVVESTEG